ncbi:hypothetical protein DF268_08365 [Streptomyces sp. V2]|uniref:hypothetical protein n=1 Tax=Streptomyces sp. V2 TaxID=1424099 RepID=UPI000D6714E5|nr:hypothetical protein [Streptomyces sp. V2]PWG13876.1 hypothetical protein DF268_08365 [Streptomyces sp. V2]
MTGLWTIAEVAAHLGVKPDSARGNLSRWKVRARERRIDEQGRAYSLYDPDEVRKAYAARPGRGNWKPES